LKMIIFVFPNITIEFYHPRLDGPIEIEGEIVRREKRGIVVKFSKEIKELAKGTLNE